MTLSIASNAISGVNSISICSVPNLAATALAANISGEPSCPTANDLSLPVAVKRREYKCTSLLEGPGHSAVIRFYNNLRGNNEVSSES